MAATGLCTGLFFLLTGLLPWEYAVELIVAPPYWLTNGFTRVALVVIGLAVIAGSLRFNVWSRKQMAIDDLAEDLSWAIHNLLNRKVKSDPDLDQVKADIDTWCDKISGKLENRTFFTRADQLHFDRLGAVPNKGWDIAYMAHPNDGRHNYVLNNLNLKFDRLRDILNWTQQRTR